MTTNNTVLFTADQIEAMRTYLKHEIAAALVSNEGLDENGMPIRTPGNIISKAIAADHALDMFKLSLGIVE